MWRKGSAVVNREGGCKDVFTKMREYLVYQSTAYGICKAVDGSFSVNADTYMVDYSTHMALFPKADKSNARMYAFVQDFVRAMISFRNNVNGGTRLTFGAMRTYIQRFIRAMREDPKCQMAIKQMDAKALDIALGFADAEGHAVYNNIPGQEIPRSSPTAYQWIGLPLSMPPKGLTEFTMIDQNAPREDAKDTRVTRDGKASFNYAEIFKNAVGFEGDIAPVTAASAKVAVDQARADAVIKDIGIAPSESDEKRDATIQAYTKALQAGRSPPEAIKIARAFLAKPAAAAVVSGGGTVLGGLASAVTNPLAGPISSEI